MFFLAAHGASGAPPARIRLMRQGHAPHAAGCSSDTRTLPACVRKYAHRACRKDAHPCRQLHWVLADALHGLTWWYKAASCADSGAAQCGRAAHVLHACRQTDLADKGPGAQAASTSAAAVRKARRAGCGHNRYQNGVRGGLWVPRVWGQSPIPNPYY